MRFSVAGLDLSLRSAGVAIIDADSQVHCYTFGSKLGDDASLKEKTWRNITITNDIIRAAKRHGVQWIGVEDYAYSQRSSSAHVLPELGGLVKAQAMLALGICPVPLTASSMRKFVVGDGGADKAAIRKHLRKRGYGQPKNFDESDALVVALVMDGYVNRRDQFCAQHELELFDGIDRKLG